MPLRSLTIEVYLALEHLGSMEKINDMFIPKPDLESMELEGWDINPKDSKVGFEG